MNPNIYNSQARTFEAAINGGKINANSNLNIIPNLNSLYQNLKGGYPSLNIENITIQTTGGQFDLLPSLKL